MSKNGPKPLTTAIKAIILHTLEVQVGFRVWGLGLRALGLGFRGGCTWGFGV